MPDLQLSFNGVNYLAQGIETPSTFQLLEAESGELVNDPTLNSLMFAYANQVSLIERLYAEGPNGERSIAEDGREQLSELLEASARFNNLSAAYEGITTTGNIVAGGFIGGLPSIAQSGLRLQEQELQHLSLNTAFEARDFSISAGEEVVLGLNDENNFSDIIALNTALSDYFTAIDFEGVVKENIEFETDSWEDWFVDQVGNVFSGIVGPTVESLENAGRLQAAYDAADILDTVNGLLSTYSQAMDTLDTEQFFRDLTNILSNELRQDEGLFAAYSAGTEDRFREFLEEMRISGEDLDRELITESGLFGPGVLNSLPNYLDTDFELGQMPDDDNEGSDTDDTVSIVPGTGQLESYPSNKNTGDGSIWSTGTGGQFANGTAFAALKSDGSVVTWGGRFSGGESEEVPNLQGSVEGIFSTGSAFAALNTDGSVVTWGSASSGGDSESVASDLQEDVIGIFSTSSAFAALKAGGAVVTWGSAANGGDSQSVADQLGADVEQIFSTGSAFAALKTDGEVITWGNGFRGGNSEALSAQLDSGVVNIFSTSESFAALRDDQSVVTWGGFAGAISDEKLEQLESGVVSIASNQDAFAALKDDGSVVTWGNSIRGGQQFVADFGGLQEVEDELTENVEALYSTSGAFAALKAGGAVVTWGSAANGGDSQSVAYQLGADVEGIFSTQSAFAALTNNGQVITWGDENSGGNSESVAEHLTGDVVEIFSTSTAFAALKSDGSVVTWGNPDQGGDSDSVSELLGEDVVTIYSGVQAFAALKTDGSVVTWGNPQFGGDSSDVDHELSSGVIGLASPFGTPFETGIRSVDTTDDEDPTHSEDEEPDDETGSTSEDSSAEQTGDPERADDINLDTENSNGPPLSGQLYTQLFFAYGFDEAGVPDIGVDILLDAPESDDEGALVLTEDQDGFFDDYLDAFAQANGEVQLLESVFFYQEDDEGNLNEVIRLDAPEGGFQSIGEVLFAYLEAVEGTGQDPEQEDGAEGDEMIEESPPERPDEFEAEDDEEEQDRAADSATESSGMSMELGAFAAMAFFLMFLLG